MSSNYEEVVLFILQNFQRDTILESKIPRTRKLVKYYNFRRIFKVNQEMQWFLGQIFHKSHVKFKYMSNSPFMVNQTFL